MAVIEFPGIFKRLFREQGESLIIKEPVMPLKENGGIVYDAEGSGMYVNVKDGGGIIVGDDGGLSVNIEEGGGLAQTEDGGIYVDIADGGGLVREGDGSLAVDMSDTYDPGSSEVAASTNALKDLYDKLNSRISDLEGQLSGGAWPLMPSSSTFMEIPDANAASSGSYALTLPSGGTWVWMVSALRVQDEWTNGTGTDLYQYSHGINSGGTVVYTGPKTEYVEGGSGESYYLVHYRLVLNICWRIA